MFCLWDIQVGVDGAQALKAPELELLLRKLAINDASELAVEVIKTVDDNGDGDIDVAELFRALSAFPRIARAMSQWKWKLQRKAGKGKGKGKDGGASTGNDDNNSQDIGRIARHISAEYKGRRVTISDFELDQLIALVDDDCNGVLGLDELVAAMDHIGLEDGAKRADKVGGCCCNVAAASLVTTATNWSHFRNESNRIEILFVQQWS